MRAHSLGDGTQQLRQIARRASAKSSSAKSVDPTAVVLADQHDLAAAPPATRSRTSEIMLSALRE